MQKIIKKTHLVNNLLRIWHGSNKYQKTKQKHKIKQFCFLVVLVLWDITFFLLKIKEYTPACY